MPTALTSPLALHNAKARVYRWLQNPRFTAEEYRACYTQALRCNDLAQLTQMEQDAMQQYHERAGVTV